MAKWYDERDDEKYAVKWGYKGFLTTTYKIVPITDLETSHSLKSEYQTVEKNGEAINIRGRKPQEIVFDTKYLSINNVDPKLQMRQWYDLIGKTYPLFVGGKQFGPPLLQLKSVEWDNFIFAPNGYIIGVDAQITLREYYGEKKLITQKQFDGWVKAHDELRKAEALAIGPSQTERQYRRGR